MKRGNQVAAVTALASSTLSPSGVSSVYYHDVFVSYNLSDRVRMYFGASNLLDRNAPGNPHVYSGTLNRSLCDNIGSYNYLGVSARL